MKIQHHPEELWINAVTVFAVKNDDVYAVMPLVDSDIANSGVGQVQYPQCLPHNHKCCGDIVF